MIFIEKMKNLKIYKTKTFLPTLKENKKKGSAVLLMTPNFESSKRLMNNEMFVNKNRFSSYYLERDVSYYINSNVVEEVDESAVLAEQAETEEFFLETKRSELPDSEFGVPEERKFPLDTEAHVRSAIRFFNYVEPKYEAELARRIIAKMKKFNITDIHVSEKNRFSKYYHPKKEAAVKESAEDKHVKKCKFCGSEDILVKIEGEPVYICKQCGKFLGVVPFREDSEMIKSDIVEAVSEISTGENLMFSSWPPAMRLLGSFSMELITAKGPLVSAPRHGEAPSFNGLPASLPSGVAPTSKPFGTYEVMLLVDMV